MKRILTFAILTCFLNVLNAQKILGVDEQFGLLYINENKKVRIETKYFAPSSYSGMGSINEFIFKNDTIKSRTLNYGDVMQEFEGYSARFEIFPFTVKVRNNGDIFFSSKDDSLIYDDKGRVREQYGLQFGDKSKKLYARFKYLSDTTIFETGITYFNVNSSGYLYELDAKCNLKSVKEFTIDTKDAIRDSVDYERIDFWKQTLFKYNKTRTRIESIQLFILDGKKRILQTTQFFIYKKDRPISSYVRDEKTGKIIYTQKYKYTTIKK